MEDIADLGERLGQGWEFQKERLRVLGGYVEDFYLGVEINWLSGFWDLVIIFDVLAEDASEGFQVADVCLVSQGDFVYSILFNCFAIFDKGVLQLVLRFFIVN